MARLSRVKAKEFKKNRYSLRFKQLKKECAAELKAIKQKKINEAVLAGSSPNSWLGKLELLLDSEGKSAKDPLTLPEHSSAGLTPKQQAEDFAIHISKISREYTPIEKAILPRRLEYALTNDCCSGHPQLDDHLVYAMLVDRKITGGVSGDLDPRVVRSCLVELTHPIAEVYRIAVSDHKWPDSWKVEKQIMIKKCPNPTTKDDMRNLGLSPYFNKGLEKILVDWLMPYVERFLSPDQMGGRKGCSTNHYLAKLVDFIYAEIDSGKPGDRRAVSTLAVDLSKAFNRLEHGKLLSMLYDMGVPTCALRLLKSYLTGRRMRVHFNGAVSGEYELWGGGPQGGLLTVLLFNLYSNWITDVCQPGTSQADRFQVEACVPALLCAFAQMKPELYLLLKALTL